MTDLAPPRPEPKRDHNGRYIIPDPVTGKEKSWTRATTWAKTIADMFIIGQWEQRMVAKGISLRSDLYALAAATAVEDKDKMNKICDQAREAAKASSGSNLGTALHAFTEHLDAGRDIPVPAPWDADVAAYRAELQKWNITVDSAWIETIVLVPQYGVAGTLDRLLHMEDGRIVIGDLKTGKRLDYSWDQIGVQLALYANATHSYDLGTGEVSPIPAGWIDQDMAIAMHLPVGKAHCDLYEVDIKAGWETAYIAKVVRDWRKNKKIAKPYVKVEPAAVILADQVSQATSGEALQTLWRINKATWTSELTNIAKARQAQLREREGATHE